MSKTTLRKLLQKNLDLYPFNDKFKIETYKDIIFSEINIEDLKKDEFQYVIRLLPFFNSIYKQYYSYLKTNILSSNINYDQLIDLVFALFNRNHFILRKQIFDHFKDAKELNQKSFFSIKINTQNNLKAKIEVSSALESDIDALSNVLNYIRHIKKDELEINNSFTPIHTIEVAKRIITLSNYFIAIKHIFDNCVWNGGYFTLNETPSKMVIKVLFPDTNLLILNNVGLLRLQRNTSTNYFLAKNDIEQNTDYGKYLKETIKSKHKEKRIKNVSITDGFINYSLSKGFGNSELYTELENLKALITYYNFLDSVKFSSLHDLDIRDLIKLFSLLQDLIDKIYNINFEDGIYSIKDVSNFPIKISRDKLIHYFLQRSLYTKEQINGFIELISFKLGDTINLYSRPLVEYNATYFICYLTASAPIIFNFIDYWIEKAGYNLDKRGKSLEKYLHFRCSKILTHKGYKFYIPKKNKFYNTHKKFEEIDLIVVLKSVVIIAEVKCIKYPLEARDKHNSLITLHKGANQITRKIDFISKYKYEILDLKELDNKEIIPLVITNFPVFTSHVIDGVPIIDFYLFESFFKTGKLTDSKIHKDGTEEITKEHFYYKNEEEMNKSIKDFLFNPFPVEEIKKYHEIVDYKVTPDVFEYDIYTTIAQISDNVNLL